MTAPAESERYDAFDGLRALMMLLVCVGHAALPYVTTPRTFHDPSSHAGFDVLVAALYGSCVPVFFLLAGFFGARLHVRRGTAGLLRNRLRTIVLPLVASYVTVVPLTRAAQEFAIAASASGSVREGARAILRGDWGAFDKSFHLWFLIALTVFYPAALAGRAALARLPDALRGRLARTARAALAGPWRPAVLALVVGVLFVASETAAGDVGRGAYLQLALLLFFGLGWSLYHWRDLLPQLQRHAWVYLGVAAAALPALTWALRAAYGRAQPESGPAALVVGTAGSVFASCATFGLLGLFLRHLDRPLSAARYASDASYWIYLVHYPVLLFVGGTLATLGLAAGAKYALVLLIAGPLLWASYHLCVRSTALGVFLGGGPRRRAQNRTSA